MELSLVTGVVGEQALRAGDWENYPLLADALDELAWGSNGEPPPDGVGAGEQVTD